MLRLRKRQSAPCFAARPPGERIFDLTQVGRVAALATSVFAAAKPMTSLPHLFKPGRLGRYATPNMVKYGACCVSNYNTRDGYITPRELARTRVIAATGCGIITNQGAYPDPKGGSRTGAASCAS
jgi:hypothetical protein